MHPNLYLNKVILTFFWLSEFVEEADISEKFAHALLEVSNKPEARTAFNENSIATPVAGNRMNEPVAVSVTHTNEHGSIAPDSAVHTIVSNSSGIASVENRGSDDDEESGSRSKAESQSTMEPWKESIPTPSPAHADEKSIADMCGGQQQGSTPRGNPTKMLFEETPADVIEKRKRIDAQQSCFPLSGDESSMRSRSTIQNTTTTQKAFSGSSFYVKQTNVSPHMEESEDANNCTTTNQAVIAKVPRRVDDSNILTSRNLKFVSASPSTTDTATILSKEIENLNVNSIDEENDNTQNHQSQVSTPVNHSEQQKNAASPDQDAMDKEMEDFSPPRMNETGSPDADELVKTFDAILNSNDASLDNHLEPENFLLTQESHLEKSKEADMTIVDPSIGRKGLDDPHGAGRMENDGPEVPRQPSGVELPTYSAVANPSAKHSDRGQVVVDDTLYEKWIQDMSESIAPDDKWVKVMRMMKDFGLKHYSGGRLSSWIYVFPGRRTKANGGLLSHDFVEDEFDLKELAFQRFNWKGDDKFRSHREASMSRERHAKRILQISPEITQKRKAEMNARPGDTRKQQRTSESDHCAMPPLSNSLSTPEMKATVGEKLLSCLRVLQTSHKYKKLANLDEGKSSRFKDQVGNIEKFLKDAISSKRTSEVRKIRKPILYVCGSPGVGKTTAVDWCCDKVVKSVKNRELAGFDSLRICRVNGVSPGDAVNSILNKIADGLDMTNKVVTMKSLATFLKKTDEMVMLVIDEVDEMVSSRGTSSLNSESEKTLHELCKLASDPSCNVSLIGISNAVDGLAATRLKMIGMMVSSNH
jgi:ATPase family associated with various cellular activities (AAA)